jgi:hypothetical protein
MSSKRFGYAFTLVNTRGLTPKRTEMRVHVPETQRSQVQIRPPRYSEFAVYPVQTGTPATAQYQWDRQMALHSVMTSKGFSFRSYIPICRFLEVMRFMKAECGAFKHGALPPHH